MRILPIRETKIKLIDFLFSRSEYVRKVNSVEIVTRCPYCGDSYKNLNMGHFYLRVDIDDNYMIPCHCFKCDHSGIINKETLELMDCNDDELITGIYLLNKKGRYSKKFVDESMYMYFDRLLPEELRHIGKIKYVKNRLGIEITKRMIGEMKIITSLYDFLIANNITESPFKKEIRMMLERDYIGFLSSGNSHILFRDVTDKHEYRWIKYPIDDRSKRNKVFYGIAGSVDVFTKEPVIINLSEGVIDAASIKYNLGYEEENTFNLAVCGQNYNSIIMHMITLGAFGSNVTLNIFSDNDKEFNDNKVKSSNESNHRKYLNKYKRLFQSINLYYNLYGKDYGVPKEEIRLDKIRI